MTVNISIGTPEIVLLAVISISVIAGVVLILFKLNKKIENLTTPKFGFLGKQLTYGLVLLALGLSTVGIATFLNKGTVESNINAEKLYDVYIQSTVLHSNEDTSNLTLKGFIYQDKKLWGRDSYNFKWTVTSADNTVIKTLDEVSVGEDFPSEVIISLQNGSYKIKLDAYKENRLIGSVEKSFDLK